MKIDLHLHTTQSDGALDIATLLRSVALSGLDYFSITDHDTMQAYVRHRSLLAPHAIRLIPGIELSTSLDGKEIHILGYNVSPDCGPLKTITANRAEMRQRRADAIIAKLQAAGTPIAMEEVRRYAGGAIIGRLHISHALVASGYARDTDDAFARFIGSSGSAYVPLTTASPRQAIAAITQCGGVAVLAHPTRNGADGLLEELRRAGLRGIEAYSPSHTPHDVERFRALAKSYDLVITAGTDFHQPTPAHPQPGVEIDATDFAPFLRLLSTSTNPKN